MSNPFIKKFHDDNKDPINILNDIDLYFNNCSWLSDAETMKDLYLLDKDNLEDLSDEKIFITVLNIEESFKLNNLIYINEKTIFGYSLSTKSVKNNQKNKFIFEELNKLSQGALLVHSEYGICRFNSASYWICFSLF